MREAFAGNGRDDSLKEGAARTEFVPIRKIAQEAPRIGSGKKPKARMENG